MALFKFTDAILNGRPIDLYNNGNMVRDFTYIDDVVEGVSRLIDKPTTANEQFETMLPDGGSSDAPWRVFNVGNGQPTPLMDYVSALEKVLGIKAKKNFMELQPGDVLITSSDTSRLENFIGYKPATTIEVGIKKFVDWYISFKD